MEEMEKNKYIRIGELAEKSGISRSMIHFYLKEKILHAPIKTSRTMAYYDESHLKRLEDIKRLKMNMKMPIDFLKQQLAELDKAKNGKSVEGNGSHQDPAFRHPKMLRKQQITQAGIKVFSEKGYHRTRVQDIIEELDISTGTFYLYFKNKQDLFISVVRDVVNALVGDAATQLKEETGFMERLRIRGQVFFNNYSKYVEILSILRGEVPNDDGWAKQTLKHIYNELTKPLVREIQNAIDKGEIYDVDPEMMAYNIFGLAEFTTFRSTLDQKYNYEKIWSSVSELLRQGLLVNKSSTP